MIAWTVFNQNTFFQEQFLYEHAKNALGETYVQYME